MAARKRRLLSGAALALLLLAGWRGGLAQDSTHTFTHDGLARSYRLHVPASYKEDRPLPLVLALHGGGGRSRNLLRGAWPQLAEREGFLLVAPDGVERSWNDGRSFAAARAHGEQIDDVGFLTALLGELKGRYSIDADRVYALGASNGGMMSLRLACERSDMFAAVAALIASLPEDLECSPAKPISVLLMNGTDDPLVPWEGGEVGFRRRRKRGRVRSTPDTVKFWVEKNGCKSTPRVTREPDRDPDDGSQVRRETYGDCADGTEVVLYAVEGGGHTWPGGPQYLPRLLIGRANRDLDATEIIWQFFRRHPRG